MRNVEDGKHGLVGAACCFPGYPEFFVGLFSLVGLFVKFTMCIDEEPLDMFKVRRVSGWMMGRASPSMKGDH